MKAMILLSKDYEETEAVAVIDILRRAEIDIDVVATEGDLDTVGDHNITIRADYLLEDIKGADYDIVITPGGVGGTNALRENAKVIDLLKEQYQSDSGYIASICASPRVLDKAGISQEIRGTIFPALSDQVTFKEYVADEIVVNDQDHRVITSQGPATAYYFALEIVRQLKGQEVHDQVAKALLIPNVEAAVNA
ncbi:MULTISPECIES: DJ-1 family glyoxalase III [Aerococcus]|uniref:DJ-1 family glyoxalase III n=1 Tax=Aerococcus TaxID=1375 RepID=UPI000DCB5FB8|nr:MULTISPECIES: DJ-1 family glyoxalase III [Aerococcus]KAA9234641.1 DJ-1 family protein [Aerococcus mictus]MDK6375473.1 DJ-1/PfpI family protein [Aerococcus urinae]MDK6421292.1 DJ-1/PfpI family protein [Aerococcus urinae]MDK8074367.1 DJ-1/PfpI family protein [Aerococcus urinae]MDK8083795.1 DJ-1/PfpI family protein [Aerococcus urinae]